MSTVSPVSTTVSAMNADRQHQHHSEDVRHAEDAPLAPTREEEVIAASAPAISPAQPVLQAPSEGTFAVSQLAERLRLLELNLRAIATGDKPWSPPHSDLNLRDRTV